MGALTGTSTALTGPGHPGMLNSPGSVYYHSAHSLPVPFSLCICLGVTVQRTVVLHGCRTQPASCHMRTAAAARKLNLSAGGDGCNGASKWHSNMLACGLG